MLCVLFYGVAALAIVASASWLPSSLLFQTSSCSVTSRNRKRSSSSSGDGGGSDKSSPNSFNQFGALPSLDAVYSSMERASPVCALRFSHETNGNGTLFVSGYDNSSTLQIPIGAQAITMLLNPFQRLLITGGAGDCRAVIRFAKQTALNHTFAFDAAPSGLYLANAIGSFLQGQTLGSDRPLACHVFLVQGLRPPFGLFSIDASGVVDQVLAGCAGRGMKQGMELLEEQYHVGNVSLSEAMSLAEQVINSPSLLQKQQEQEGGEGGGDAEERTSYRAFALEYAVIYDNNNAF